MKNNPLINNTRVFALYFGLGLLLVAICVRAGYLYFNETSKYSKHGLTRSLKAVTVPATKGIIKDRNGEILAITTVLYTLIIDLNHLRIKPNSSKLQTKIAKRRILTFKSKLEQLANILQLPKKLIHEKVFLQSPTKVQVYLAKGLSPTKVDKLTNLKIPALVFKSRFKRFYPYGEILANVIGFSDYVNIGRSGVEQSYDKYLRGKNGTMWFRRDRTGDVISYVAGDNEYKKGKNLSLTIDTKIQNFAFMALNDGIKKSKAKSGTAVVMDAKTGEILAMTNLPSYNTNDHSQRVGTGTSNIAIQELFEPGSIIKPFVVLAGLESKVVDANSRLFLGKKQPEHQVKVADRVFKDTAKIYKNNIELATLLKKSSNVGAIKLGLRINNDDLITTLHKVGFGKPVDINLYGGKFTGILPKKLSKVKKASLSIGYSMNANVLQMARAYSIFTNQGSLVDIKLVLDKPTKKTQVASKKNTQLITNWLKKVTDKDGTAPFAKISGFDVAGKTGTTLLSLGNKGYAKKQYISSFIGFAPLKNPKLIVAVLIQQPQSKSYYGGQVAAPVFAKITATTLNYLGVRSNKQRSLVKVLQKTKS